MASDKALSLHKPQKYYLLEQFGTFDTHMAYEFLSISNTDEKFKSNSLYFIELVAFRKNTCKNFNLTVVNNNW